MPKYIFALSPGRAGSTTFAEACAHFSNFTSAHESRNARIGNVRFDYPENHIEADNRLTWHLGQMATRFDGQDAFYVHLRRDPEKIAQSYLNRWEQIKFSGAILPAFANGIIMRESLWPAERRIDVCRFYVETVIANTEEFLKTRSHMDVSLEDDGASFESFMDRIGAQGDLAAALSAWKTPANTHGHSLEKAKKPLSLRVKQQVKDLLTR